MVVVCQIVFLVQRFVPYQQLEGKISYAKNESKLSRLMTEVCEDRNTLHRRMEFVFFFFFLSAKSKAIYEINRVEAPH